MYVYELFLPVVLPEDSSFEIPLPTFTEDWDDYVWPAVRMRASDMENVMPWCDSLVKSQRAQILRRKLVNNRFNYRPLLVQDFGQQYLANTTIRQVLCQKKRVNLLTDKYRHRYYLGIYWKYCPVLSFTSSIGFWDGDLEVSTKQGGAKAGARNNRRIGTI